jgi:TonB family protein
MKLRPLGIAMALSLLVHGLAAGAVAPSEHDETRRIVERVAAMLPPARVTTTIASPPIEPVVVAASPPAVAAALLPKVAEPMKSAQRPGGVPEAPRSETRPSRKHKARPRAARVRPPDPPPVVASAMPADTPAPIATRRGGPSDPALSPGVEDRAASASPAGSDETTGARATTAGSASGATGPGTPTDAQTVRRAWLGRLSAAAQRHLKYPHAARRLGLTGDSVVAVRFGAGTAPGCTIHVSTGHASLDAAAIAAVEKALANCPIPSGIADSGRPVFVPVRFQLQ